MDSHQPAPSFQVPKDQESTSAVHATHANEVVPTEGGLPAPVVLPNHDSGTSASVAVATDGIIADDIDVIEKEWVDRAKKVISMTSTDPHAEVYELSKLRAAYLKRRFNKDLPLAGDKK